MIYGYIRVSSDKQTTENQRFEITRFAQLQGIKINKWIEETISSRKPLNKRKLGSLLAELKDGDILISTEISRLGRSLLEVMSILQNCLTKNCEVWTLKENYRLGSDIFVLSDISCLSISADKPNANANTFEPMSEPKR